MTISHITIEGNIATKREMRTFNKRDGEGKLINFTVAVNDRKFDKNSGEWKSNTHFFSVVAMDRKAENFEQTFQVGDPIIVTGGLTVKDTYTDRNGVEHAGELEIFADNFGHSIRYPVSIDRSRRTSGGSNNSAPSYNSAPSAPAAPKAEEPKKNNASAFSLDDDDDDDLASWDTDI